MDENKIEVVEETTDMEPETFEWTEFPSEASTKRLNIGAVALAGAAIGGLVYGAKKVWDWRKARKARKMAEAEDDDFDEIVDLDDEEEPETVITVEAKDEKVEEETKKEETKPEK